jgi:putative ABC transport system substrate-binding protein
MIGSQSMALEVELMDRRTFVAVLASASVTLARAADAQRATRVYRIGYFQGRAYLPERDNIFRQALRELGWIEGQNVEIEYRYGDGRLDKMTAIAAELVRLNVDVIVTSGTTAVRIAKEATGTIPIVMMSGEPVMTRLVASLARPGGNLTGLTHVTKETIGKRLALLSEVVPKATRVAAIFNPDNPGEAMFSSEMESTAQALHLQLVLFKVTSADQLDGAFARAVEQHVQGVLVLEDPVFTGNPRKVTELATRHRMPAVYGSAVYARAGGLMSYGADFDDLYRRAATYVDKILKGVKPADMPIEQPSKFELVVNLQTAKALAITIPQALLVRADEVIR